MRFIDNIWAADRNVKQLLCVIDVLPNMLGLKPLKDKKGKTVLNAFLDTANESIRLDSLAILIKALRTVLLFLPFKNFNRSIFRKNIYHI